MHILPLFEGLQVKSSSLRRVNPYWDEYERILTKVGEFSNDPDEFKPRDKTSRRLKDYKQSDG